MEEPIGKFDINGPGNTRQAFWIALLPGERAAHYNTHPVGTDGILPDGTANAPQAILKASRQIDFFMREIPMHGSSELQCFPSLLI
ncbi:MAG: hypothetical protein WDN75_21015 [Bacteroidota bacterium]